MESLTCSRTDKRCSPATTTTPAKATIALKAGVWFRRVRFVMLSPDSRQAAPLSGRKSTYRPVQIPRASSLRSESSPAASASLGAFRFASAWRRGQFSSDRIVRSEFSRCSFDRHSFVSNRRKSMGRGILLWLIGVPIPIIILLALAESVKMLSVMVFRRGSKSKML